MKRIINEMKLRLPALSRNEAVARSVISSFAAELDPTVEELCDVRCAVSEAVTNCIVHAYKDCEHPEHSYIYPQGSMITVRCRWKFPTMGAVSRTWRPQECRISPRESLARDAVWDSL